MEKQKVERAVFRNTISGARLVVLTKEGIERTERAFPTTWRRT